MSMVALDDHKSMRPYLRPLVLLPLRTSFVPAPPQTRVPPVIVEGKWVASSAAADSHINKDTAGIQESGIKEQHSRYASLP